ncbi:MAG: sigma-70 family RNA polymerase sigma factor [Chitinophagaceae bacterium]|nr:sigma-70 family RNA polymerase sigma factor [Chitinophagaceae bacterium]
MNNQTRMPDETLIQFYLKGDPNAMATLVELYKDRVYSSIYNIVQDKYAAEEIFQEVFICLINNMIAGKQSEEGNFLQWASRIAQQLCMEYKRKTSLALVLNDPAEKINFSMPAALPATHYHQSLGKIKSMIDMLPDSQREVMLLNHYGGLSFNEIAATLKCSLSMALDCMKLALNNLRKMMTEKEIVLG